MNVQALPIHGPRPATVRPRAAGIVRVNFLLMSGFQMLAVSAAQEPLAKANIVLGERAYVWRLLSADGSSVRSHEGWSVSVDAAIDPGECAEVSFACGEAAEGSSNARLVQDQLRRQWRMGRMVGGLCDGVRSLARAGILRDRRVALHWSDAPSFFALWPDTKPVEGTYCIDNRILSCAGPLSAADLMLQMIELDHGSAVVQRVMDLCLIRTRRNPEDSQTAALAPRLACRNPNLLRAVDWIDRNFTDEFCLEDAVKASGVSQRQLQRLFRQYVGRSQVSYITERRLVHARHLLSETNLSVREVSERCGYMSVENFSKSFTRFFGFSPSKTGNSMNVSVQLNCKGLGGSDLQQRVSRDPGQ